MKSQAFCFWALVLVLAALSTPVAATASAEDGSELMLVVERDPGQKGVIEVGDVLSTHGDPDELGGSEQVKPTPVSDVLGLNGVRDPFVRLWDKLLLLTGLQLRF